MTTLEAISSALILAAAGAGHCIGMCGALSMNMTFAIPESQRRGWRLPVWQGLFSAGRLTSYALLGALVSLGGEQLLAQLPGGQSLPWLLAAIVMLIMAGYFVGYSLGVNALERMGQALWRRIQPLVGKLMPINSPVRALTVGLLWGLMPCGLVYSALALAAVSGNVLSGVTVMLSFGLVTVLPVSLTGMASGLLGGAQSPWLRRLGAVSALAMAGWLFWHAISASGHAHHGSSGTTVTESGGSAEHHHHH